MGLHPSVRKPLSPPVHNHKWRRHEWKEGGAQKQPSLQPSSHPRSSPALSAAASISHIPDINACPSGGLTGGRTVSRSATTIRWLLSFYYYFLIFVCIFWFLSSSVWTDAPVSPCTKPCANPPHTKSRKWLQVHVLKGTVTQGEKPWGPPDDRHPHSNKNTYINRFIFILFFLVKNQKHIYRIMLLILPLYVKDIIDATSDRISLMKIYFSSASPLNRL